MDLSSLKPSMKFIQKDYFEYVMNIIWNDNDVILDLFEIDSLTDTIRNKSNIKYNNKNVIENINTWIFQPDSAKLTYNEYNELTFLLYKAKICIGALKIHHFTS